MAKFNNKGSNARTSASDPGILQTDILSFLATCRRPALLDFGDKPIPLEAGRFSVEVRNGGLWIEAWDENRSIRRRILSIRRRTLGVCDCIVQRFGGRTGDLTLLDLGRPQTAVRALRGERQNFGEQFRRMLARQFPGWDLLSLSSELDLRHSFSSAFPRAHLVRANQHLVALACGQAMDEPSFLSSALLWHDYVLGQQRKAINLPLCLFLPETAGTLTAHRLRWLTGRELRPHLFRFNEHGMAGEIDPRDLGNLDTRLCSHYSAPVIDAECRRELARLDGQREIGCIPELSGSISIRFRGLEFARLERGRLLLGLEDPEELPLSDFSKVFGFAEHLSALPKARSAISPVLTTFPERWFESIVRANLPQLDAEILPESARGQVLTFAAGDRDLIDLLALNYSQQLVVLELKTSPDMHLPLQALDYWMRVQWHADRAELDSFFPDARLAATAPKLYLVAPALSFHPANEILLRYFSHDIDVQRIGVNSDWERALQVVFRLRGADVPISHQRSR